MEAGMSKRVALYVRVSTDGQTTANQTHELAAWTARCGYTVVQVYKDEGISGAKGRHKRPGLDAMLKDANRRQFDQVAVWAVNRLGRSMSDLVRTLDDLKAAGLDLYLHGQGLDTSPPIGEAGPWYVDDATGAVGRVRLLQPPTRQIQPFGVVPGGPVQRPLPPGARSQGPIVQH